MAWVLCGIRFFLPLLLSIGIIRWGSSAFAGSGNLTEIQETVITGEALRQGADPGLVLDFSVVMLAGGRWNPEAVKEHLRHMDRIFLKCGIGVGKVRFVTGRSSVRKFFDAGLSCTRFRDRRRREYRCLRGPGSRNHEASVQALAQQTAAFGRPALHLVEKLDTGEEVGIAFGRHVDQGESKLWTSRKTLPGPVTKEEERHLNYFNQALGTAWVAHNIESDRGGEGLPSKVTDSRLGIAISHEMAHLMGIPHDETDPPSFMHSRPGASDSVNPELCKALRASPLLRKTGGTSPPSSSDPSPAGGAK